MRRIPDRLLVGLLLGLAAAGLLIILRQTIAGGSGTDFNIDYAAGVLLRQGRFADVYSQPALVSTIHRAMPQSAIDPRLPFNLPLAAALPDALLAFFPPAAAFRVWVLISMALMLGSVVLLQRAWFLHPRALLYGALAILAAVPAWATLTEGQVTPIVLMGATLLTVSVSRIGLASSGLAALGGALLVVKPQYLPPYLLILVAARNWRALLAAIAGASPVLLSPLIAGPPSLVAMVNNALLADKTVSIRANETWMGVIGAVLPARIAIALGLVIFACSLVTLGWIAWRRTLGQVPFMLLAGGLALLASPHGLPQDALVLLIPAWLSFALYPRDQWRLPALGWVAVDLALVVDLHGIGVPLAPVALTLSLGFLLWRFRRQAASQERRPPVALAG